MSDKAGKQSEVSRQYEANKGDYSWYVYQKPDFRLF